MTDTSEPMRRVGAVGERLDSFNTARLWYAYLEHDPDEGADNDMYG
jgi:hypothetical protein